MFSFFYHIIKNMGNEYAPIVKAYIDPGTGSALFAVLIGLISVVVYGIKGFIIKIKTGVLHKKDKSIKAAYVIYSDSKRYWNLFKPICDEFEKNCTSLMYLTQSSDDPIFNENYKYVNAEYIGGGNKGISKMNFLSADIVLSTTPSLDVYQWKRSKAVKCYIHIPHACNDLTMYRMFGIDYYDVVLTSGQFQVEQVRQLEKLRGLKTKQCEVVGLTYFDEMYKRLLESGISKKDCVSSPTVLLAPSWGKSSLLNRFGERLIEKLIETGYKIIVRPHPQSYSSEKELLDSLIDKFPELEWNNDNDNFNVLNKSDIMISDFSGVIFDFSLVFDKPIIYTNEKFDDSIYDSSWLNDTPWTFRMLPKIGKELNSDNINMIKNIIDECLNSREFANGRKEAKQESWFNVGKAAENIYRFMVNKEKELEK